jgi:hypothetical protein
MGGARGGGDRPEAAQLVHGVVGARVEGGAAGPAVEGRRADEKMGRGAMVRWDGVERDDGAITGA